MIRRIELVNFMSHSDTVIEPADGLTVLAGPNNCGKSAVVVALQTLCGQHAGDFMVRHGQKECRVTVQTDDGHVIEWRRKGAVVSYNIDGKDIHRLQRQVPDELQPLLRLPEVSDPEGKEAFDIHFADQKHPIFLLDKPGRQAAVFFASTSDAAFLMEMQRRHKEKTRDARGCEKHLADEAESLTRQVTALEPVERIDRDLAEIEKSFERLRQETEQLAILASRIDQVQRQELVTCQIAQRAAAMARLPMPPTLADTAPLESLYRTFRQQATAIGANNDRVRALDALVEPPVLHDTVALSSLVSALQTAVDAAGKVAARGRILDCLLPVPDLVETVPLAEQIRLQAEAEASTARYRQDLARAAAEQSAAEQAIRRWVQANPICTRCGATIDPDKLISAGGHTHAQG